MLPRARQTPDPPQPARAACPTGPGSDPLGGRCMQCPRCQHHNVTGQKFCGECGMALGQADSPGKYGTPESYTPKHLAEKILTSKAALEGERKQVTVLFADL